MILIQELAAPIDGYWDGGPKKYFEWRIDWTRRRHDSRGEFVRVGSYEANNWFNVAVGKSEWATLANARRKLSALCKRHNAPCTFKYEGEETL